MYISEVLIIGSGIAGLRFGFALSPHVKITVLTKRRTKSSNTQWAQGGIAAAWEETDLGKSMLRTL